MHSPTSYTVYYTYAKKYDRSRMLSGTIRWGWFNPPSLWEHYEPVRLTIAKAHNACHVMLYAVISDEEMERCKGIKDFLYQNGSRKRGLYKPWENHDSIDGTGGGESTHELARERGADEPPPDGSGTPDSTALEDAPQ